MNKSQIDREVTYGVSLSIAKEMLTQGLIENHEFAKIQRFLAEKHRPLVQSVEGWKDEEPRQKT